MLKFSHFGWGNVTCNGPSKPKKKDLHALSADIKTSQQEESARERALCQLTECF